MTRSPILISGWAAPHVPTRRKVCTPSSFSSSTAIATDGPPIPVDIVDTFTPSSEPVNVLYSRLNATSRARSRYFAIIGVRPGSPGTSTYSPTSPAARPMWYFFSVTAIGRILIRPRDSVFVDAGQHVGRPAHLVVDQPPRVAQTGSHAVDQLLRARVHGDEWVAGTHTRADPSFDDQARGRIAPALFAQAARAQLERGQPDLEGVDRLHVAFSLRGHGDLDGRHRQALFEVAALGGEHALEGLAPGS